VESSSAEQNLFLEITWIRNEVNSGDKSVLEIRFMSWARNKWSENWFCYRRKEDIYNFVISILLYDTQKMSHCMWNSLLFLPGTKSAPSLLKDNPKIRMCLIFCQFFQWVQIDFRIRSRPRRRRGSASKERPRRRRGSARRCVFTLISAQDNYTKGHANKIFLH